MTGLIFAVPGAAYAQDTDQTDASEEDWRNSRRKAKTNDGFDPILNPNSVGAGGVLPPLEPIDTLPEDSRRHLQRQRAKIIAELELGEAPGDIPLEPSEAAKSDPQLAADEEEAWEVILTDLQGSSGSGAEGPGGPNKVAVAGRGGGSDRSLTRGGSSQSAAEILAALKGRQSGGGGGAPAQGPVGNGQSQQAGSPSAAGNGAPSGSPGQGDSNGAGSDGGGGAGGSGGEGGADDAAASSSADDDPFKLPERQSPLEDGRGAASSASDYLKGTTGTDTETPPPPDEN